MISLGQTSPWKEGRKCSLLGGMACSSKPFVTGNGSSLTRFEALCLVFCVLRSYSPPPQMNLASQSVLEGLNACLDHRGEVGVSVLSHVTSPLFAVWLPHRCTSQNLAEHSLSNRAHASLPARILRNRERVGRAYHVPLSTASLRSDYGRDHVC